MSVWGRSLLLMREIWAVGEREMAFVQEGEVWFLYVSCGVLGAVGGVGWLVLGGGVDVVCCFWMFDKSVWSVQ